MAVSTPNSIDAAAMDETSRLSTLTDENTRGDSMEDGKSDEEGNSSPEDQPPDKKTEVPKVKDKKEATEIFKDLLREKVRIYLLKISFLFFYISMPYFFQTIHSSATWEQASKIICRDPRFKVFEKNNERKQAFNAYKIQKQKDEREEARQKTKKAKEDLESFLLNNEKMTSITKYYRCEEMFGSMEVWRSVSKTKISSCNIFTYINELLQFISFLSFNRYLMLIEGIFTRM